jgi:hypothetical protein
VPDPPPHDFDLSDPMQICESRNAKPEARSSGRSSRLTSPDVVGWNSRCKRPEAEAEAVHYCTEGLLGSQNGDRRSRSRPSRLDLSIDFRWWARKRQHLSLIAPNKLAILNSIWHSWRHGAQNR